MGNTHIKTPNRKVRKQVAPVAPVAPDGFLDDDRVRCSQCQHCGEREADEFVNLEWARQLRAMGKRLGMKGDKFQEQGKWLRISWTEPYCQATGFSPIPGQQLHRCHLFAEKPASVESEAWWLQ